MYTIHVHMCECVCVWMCVCTCICVWVWVGWCRSEGHNNCGEVQHQHHSNSFPNRFYRSVVLISCTWLPQRTIFSPSAGWLISSSRWDTLVCSWCATLLWSVRVPNNSYPRNEDTARYRIAPNFRGILFSWISWLSSRSQFFFNENLIFGAWPFHERSMWLNQVLIKIWLCWLTLRNPTLQRQCYQVLLGLSHCKCHPSVLSSWGA